MEKKQSSIEWLLKQFEEYGYDGIVLENVVEKAKAMHKEEIEECWNVAHQAGRFEGKGIAETDWITFKKYYNETFGDNNE